MILVEGEKYACEQCIRGHRSSTCKHIKRPLVLVRSRGRPLTDSTQRIAIMAEEVQKLENQIIEDKKSNKKVNGNSNDININIDRIESSIKTIERDIGNNSKKSKNIDNHSEGPNNKINDNNAKKQRCCSNQKPEFNKLSPCCSSNSKIESLSSTPELDCNCCSTNSKDHKTCKNKSKSVFILKASKRQVYNVEKESLKLLDPIIDIPNNQVGLEIMNKVSKLKKHGVNVCRSRKIKQERLVSDLNDLNNPNIIMNVCTDSSNNIENNNNIGINNKSNDNIDLHQQPPLVYQFQLPINDTNYSVNRSANANNISYTNSYPNIADLQLKSQNSVQIPQKEQSDIYPILKSNNHGLLYDLYIADSCTVPGSCACEPDKCACANCSEHNSQYRNSNLTLRQQFEQFPFPVTNHQFNDTGQEIALSQPNPIISYGQVEVQPSVQNFYKILMQQANSTDSPSSDLASMAECLCNADECACFSCETHGIVNGVRSSDNVIVASSIGTPNEIQLLASEFPINNTPTPIEPLNADENNNNSINNFMFPNSVSPKRESPVSCCSSNNKSFNIQANNGSCCNSTTAVDAQIKEKIIGKFNPIPNFKKIDSSCCSGKHIQVDQTPNRFVGVNSDNNYNYNNNNYNHNIQTLDMNNINAYMNMNNHELLFDLSEFDDCTCPDDSCNCENCFRHGKFGNISFS